MRFLSLAAAAAMSILASVNIAAAEAPVKWTGWYFGLQGGWAKASAAQTNTNSNVSNGYYDQSGWLAGGTAGYNWQFTNWVFGVETDLAWAGIKGQETDCGTSHNQTCPTEIRAFGTLRGRAGMLVWPNTLIYATGGLAYAEIHAYKESVAVTGGDDWRAGWTLGGGAEVMFMPNWSVKAEYLYTNFTGTQTTYTIAASGTPVAAAERNIHMFRGGLNWHF